MATYSKVTDDKGTVRYREGNKFTSADKLPNQVKSSLDEKEDGVQVDELGDVVNPETDIDESEDEQAPTQAEEEVEEEEEEETPIESSATPQDNPGFGFKRKDGKTLSIFSNKPHETVRLVNGIMVPLTHLEASGDPANDVAPKTDVEIVNKLKKLKKL